MKKKVVPKLRQEKVKVDIVASDDIKIYYTGKFQDFTARYIIKLHCAQFQYHFNVSTKFQYNGSKTVGRICNKKLPIYCRQTDE